MSNAQQVKKILIVDDEPAVVSYLEMLLRDGGYETLSAADGREAIEIARREKPDLLTLDLAMPGTSGSDVFEQLRKDPELVDLPIFIITGRPELRRLIYTRSVMPPDGYLDKPITEQSLLMNVRKVLELAD